ncbi:MAG TPA: hypothetical protein DCE60_01230 [Coprococcus sp.]|nr:hypothetical protein DXB01_02735 [Clostridium sp. OF10-22XD]HAB87632.1 hypothetical protein [Coprococcus sp.]
MRCTLPVNTGACLSRRRVSTGVFTNQACATNRNRSKPFIVGRPTAHASHPYQPRRLTEAGRRTATSPNFRLVRIIRFMYNKTYGVFSTPP